MIRLSKRSRLPSGTLRMGFASKRTWCVTGKFPSWSPPEWEVPRGTELGPFWHPRGRSVEAADCRFAPQHHHQSLHCTKGATEAPVAGSRRHTSAPNEPKSLSEPYQSHLCIEARMHAGRRKREEKSSQRRHHALMSRAAVPDGSDAACRHQTTGQNMSVHL